MAFLSHVPQIVAWALADAARADAVTRRHLRLAGPAWRDMTRIAGSPRTLWAQILDQNRGEVRRALAALPARPRPARAAMTAPPDPAALDFVLRLGRGLHRYGYPAHRLEETLVGVARRLGLEGQFFSMPTALFASFGAAADQRTFQIRVDPGAVELGRLAQLDAIGSDVAAGRMPPGEGNHALDAVIDAPAPYGALLTTAAFALTSGAAARFFGGGCARSRWRR